MLGDKEVDASAWAEVTVSREHALEIMLMACALRAESHQGAQFPFPTFTTGTVIIVFICPPAQKVSSAAAVWFIHQ